MGQRKAVVLYTSLTFMWLGPFQRLGSLAWGLWNLHFQSTRQTFWIDDNHLFSLKSFFLTFPLIFTFSTCHISQKGWGFSFPAKAVRQNCWFSLFFFRLSLKSIFPSPYGELKLVTKLMSFKHCVFLLCSLSDTNISPHNSQVFFISLSAFFMVSCLPHLLRDHSLSSMADKCEHTEIWGEAANTRSLLPPWEGRSWTSRADQNEEEILDTLTEYIRMLFQLSLS